MKRATTFATGLALALALSGWVGAAAGAVDLPAKLTDQEFWKLTEELSEPSGYFQSDNLLSNEMGYPVVIPALVERVKPGAVYMGVGPEQNFHYIVAIRPAMVFITDIRRGNLHLHLMYKALFELAADRSDFFARLFTKPRQSGLSASSTGADIVNAYWNVPTSDEAAYKGNLQALFDHLEKKHGFPLSSEDKAGIDYVYGNFYYFGPAITYSSSGGRGGGNRATYADLMMTGRSYLETEAGFAFLKDLQSKNLVVPVVGNFGGPKAIRAVGSYVRDRGARVTAFYLSNVEQYLNQSGIWGNFCASVATLPLDETSTFIRSRGGMGLGAMLAEVRGCGGAPVALARGTPR